MAKFSTVLPEGRIVKGHPLVVKDVMDEDTKQPKIGNDGQPMKDIYVGFAIPKTQADFKQEKWAEAWIQASTDSENGYPNGEWQRTDFSWKIADGDSTIPNKAGTVMANLPGHAGHWIINISTRLVSKGIACFPHGQFDDSKKYSLLDEQTGRADRLKCGDYGQFAIEVTGNKSNGKAAKTPGVYVNPVAFMKTRDGVEIVGEAGAVTASAAAALFGGIATVAPPVAAPAPVMTPPPAVPAMDMVTPPAMWTYSGTTLPESEWLANGWSLEQLQQNATKS